MSTVVFAQSTGIILNRLHAHEVFLYQLTFLRKSKVKEEGREKGKDRMDENKGVLLYIAFVSKV